MENEAEKIINLNQMHKRFVAFFTGDDMRIIWKKVRKMYKKDRKEELPKRFTKKWEAWENLQKWYENLVLEREKTGWVEKKYYNKQDLKNQGWDEKIIKILYPKPDRIMYLGRGRHAYYYDADLIHQMQDSEEFIEYIALKEERKMRKNARKKNQNNPKNNGFGTEFIR